MRVRARDGDISVHAVAGTHVVLLGMDVAEAAAAGLLGFAIERTDHTEGERTVLENPLLFEVNDRGAASDRSSLLNPVQAFLWGDYAAKPAHTYSYRVTAMRGAPATLQSGPSVEVRVTTEDPDDGEHGVYFNRGVAASGAYVRRFGDADPATVPNRAAYQWLSRGLEEAVRAFIGRAVDGRFALRAAMYEFKWGPVLDAFKVAADSGADVEIVYHAVPKTGDPTPADNLAAIEAARLATRSTKRLRTRIAHNKFIVLLENGKPIEVWTGSTNITEGGLFGHANAGHRIANRRVAKAYLDYWNQLRSDPERPALRAVLDPQPAFPALLPRTDSKTIVFSPRTELTPLDWYVRLADNAGQAVFLTAAFGLTQEIGPVFSGSRDYLRYLLLDLRTGEIEAMRREPSNVVAAGGLKGRGGFRKWIAATLQRLNVNVDYIHTKFMLVDPLSEAPIVVTGSANWSDESVKFNDENMVVIRGDQRVADIYLSEFMRLFNHYRLRGKARTPRSQPEDGPSDNRARRARLHLEPDDSWARPFYVAGSPEEKERLLFA
jgi:phosphatidylserine/phosphatidylglycerophosphate/cardiolipin synthase-like enzyme